MRIKATILVEPIAKARPRHRTLPDGRIIDYIPKPTLTAQGLIQAHIRRVVLEKGNFPPDIPIKMTVLFYRLRPKSTPRRVTKPITRPDIDHYLSLVFDALNKFVFRDDSQVTTVFTKKRFGDPPRIELLIEEDIDE